MPVRLDVGTILGRFVAQLFIIGYHGYAQEGDGSVEQEQAEEGPQHLGKAEATNLAESNEGSRPRHAAPAGLESVASDGGPGEEAREPVSQASRGENVDEASGETDESPRAEAERVAHAQPTPNRPNVPWDEDPETALDLMFARHAVRSFTDEPIDQETREALEREVRRGNEAGRLHMILAWDEPEAFDSRLAHYGHFTGVHNYLVIAGPADKGLDARAGYFGERVVLLAQQLGLNSCWVAMSYKRRLVRASLPKGDKLVIVVALGHGTTQGKMHPSKSVPQVSKPAINVPDWFTKGVQATLLAPTAMNQQGFWITLTGRRDLQSRDIVQIQPGSGPCAKIDAGIARLHFELGAGEKNFAWSDSLL
jgi:nitroreductase